MAHQTSSSADGTEVSSTHDRRSILVGFAVAGAAVPLLAACGSGDASAGDSTRNTSDRTGSGDSTTKSGGSSTTTKDTSGSSGDAAVLVAASKVPVGGGVILDAQKIVVTQPTSGDFEGFSAICTHMGCLVATISGGLIHCPCHGSEYSITDGSVQGGPAPAPLPKKPVKEVGGNIVEA